MAFIVPLFAAMGSGAAAAGTAAAAAGTAGALTASTSLIGAGLTAGSLSTAAAGIGSGLGMMAGTLMPYAGTALSALGTGASYKASREQAAGQKAAAEATQLQLNQEAGQASAAGQREALARSKQAESIASRALAVAAASGAGTTGIEGLLAGIAQEGEQQAGYALYSSREQATGQRYQGSLGRMSAGLSARTTRREGNATLLSGTSALYGRFFG